MLISGCPLAVLHCLPKAESPDATIANILILMVV
jgi:hypothetical protein